jgi:hypothetical protein
VRQQIEADFPGTGKTASFLFQMADQSFSFFLILILILILILSSCPYSRGIMSSQLNKTPQTPFVLKWIFYRKMTL